MDVARRDSVPRVTARPSRDDERRRLALKAKNVFACFWFLVVLLVAVRLIEMRFLSVCV